MTFGHFLQQNGIFKTTTHEINKDVIDNKNELANQRSQDVLVPFYSTIWSRLNFSLISFHSLLLIGRFEEISDCICCWLNLNLLTKWTMNNTVKIKGNG